MPTIEERKYNNESLTWDLAKNICSSCRNKQPTVAGIPGYNKVFCLAYPERKPSGVNLGRVKDCPKYKKE